jgi:hypothetical protein
MKQDGVPAARPIEVSANGQVFPITQPIQRIIIAAFACSANRTVSSVALIEVIWAEEPSRKRIKNLHYHISQVRRLFRNLYSRADELGKASGAVGWFRAAQCYTAIGDDGAALSAMGRCLELDGTAIEAQEYVRKFSHGRQIVSAAAS